MRTRLPYADAALALEPGDALALRRAAARPGLAARQAQARRALAAPASTGPWLAAHRGAISLGALHLDAGPWRPGDRLPVLLPADLPPAARLRVEVHTRAGCTVLSPAAEGHLRLGQLRCDNEGRYALDLVLDAVEGLHRVVVEVLGEGDDTLLASAEAGVRVEIG
ncbi:hypothetical protein L6R53_03935 [Myxococcota bacterium]|nr:hypothetical protein [Myxococcota bacterium]